TQAYIGNNAHLNKSTIQTIDSLIGANSTVTANAAQAVDVAAVNQASDFSFAGGLAIGEAGLAGGVDVGILNTSTQAWIANGASVAAQQDIDVYALSNDNVRTYALSAAGAALVGAAGSVSVWSIGALFNAGYTDGNSKDG